MTPPFAQLEIDFDAIQQIQVAEYKPAEQSWPLTPLQAIVLSIFQARGNLTDTELENHYELIWHVCEWQQVRPGTVRKRRSELTNLGLLVESGEKRPNGFGSLERVWELAR